VHEPATPLPWTESAWLEGANAWIDERLAEHAVVRTGPLEQPHVRWWSTVLRVPTNRGDLWFKAVSRLHTFEARLTALLAEVAPDLVPIPLAVDEERAWMLLHDGGTRLRERLDSVADLVHWERLLPRYADLQIRLGARRDELLHLGVPDQRLGRLTDDLRAVLDERGTLLIGDPEGLSEHEHERLRGQLPAIADLAQELDARGIPETLQHDDFHDGNVFVDGDGYRFFDWGDSCVSHPFHTLVVTLRSTAYRFDLEPGGSELLRLRDAYLEPWTAFGTRAELVAGFDTAYRTGTIARALAWYRYVTSLDAGARGEDAQSVPYGLKLFLADGPIGAWDV
jgi:Phosphotransferase enzyme family